MESWFHTIKTELVGHRVYKTRLPAKADIFGYIEISYNRSRMHSALGYMIPAQYEMIKMLLNHMSIKPRENHCPPESLVQEKLSEL